MLGGPSGVLLFGGVEGRGWLGDVGDCGGDR